MRRFDKGGLLRAAALALVVLCGALVSAWAQDFSIVNPTYDANSFSHIGPKLSVLGSVGGMVQDGSNVINPAALNHFYTYTGQIVAATTTSNTAAQNQSAINTAIAAACAAANSQQIIIPSGSISVQTPLTPINCNYVGVTGAGNGTTTITPTGTGDLFTWTPVANTPNNQGGELANLAIFRNDSPSAGDGLKLDHANNFRTQNVSISGVFKDVECLTCAYITLDAASRFTGVETQPGSALVQIHRLVQQQTTSGSTASGNVLPFVSVANIYVGQTVTGDANIPANTVVASISGLNVTISQAITGTVGVEALTFSDINPSNITIDATIDSACAPSCGYTYDNGLLIQDVDGMWITRNHVAWARFYSMLVQPEHSTDNIDGIISTGAWFDPSGIKNVAFLPYGAVVLYTTASTASTNTTLTFGISTAPSRAASTTINIPLTGASIVGPIYSGQGVTGTGVPANTVVTYFDALHNTVWLNQAVNVANNASLTFTPPSFAGTTGYTINATGVPAGTTATPGSGTITMSAGATTQTVASGATVVLYPAFSGRNAFSVLNATMQGAIGDGLFVADPALNGLSVIGSTILNSEFRAMDIEAGTNINISGGVYQLNNRVNANSPTLLIGGNATQVNVDSNTFSTGSGNTQPSFINKTGNSFGVQIGLGNRFAPESGAITNTNIIDTSLGVNVAYLSPLSQHVIAAYDQSGAISAEFQGFATSTPNTSAFPILQAAGGRWTLYGGGVSTGGSIDAEASSAGTLSVGADHGDTVNLGGYRVKTASKTANYLVTSADSDSHFDNWQAVGEVDFSLPPYAAGLNYCFVVATAQTLKVIAPASNAIAIGASNSALGGNVTNATPFSAVCLYATAQANQWAATSSTGSWSVN